VKLVVEDPEYLARITEKDRCFIESLDENALQCFATDTDGYVATTVSCHASFEAFAIESTASPSKAMNKKLAVQIIQIDSSMSGIGVACRKGLKRDGPNQDSWNVLKMDTCSIYGVFDGHGKSGNSVSNFVKEALLWIITKDSRFGSTNSVDVLQMLQEAHTRTQSMISAATQMKKINATHSGSTSTLVIHDHVEDVLYLSWLGHSGATLGRLGGSQMSPQRTRRHSRDSRSSLGNGSLDSYLTQTSPGSAAQNSRNSRNTRSSLGTLDSYQTQDSPGSAPQNSRHSRNSRSSLGTLDSYQTQNSPRRLAPRNSRSSRGSLESHNTEHSLGSAVSALPTSITAQLHLTSCTLTWDHRPELPIERSRIEDIGGHIVSKPSCLPNGRASYHVFAPARKYPQHGLIPALQVMSYPATDSSRTFGDLKGHSDAGLTEEPSQKVCKLRHEDKILLLCSDGVWDVLAEEDAVKIVMEFPKDQAMKAAHTLAVEARSRWMGKGEPDDITIIVIYLD